MAFKTKGQLSDHEHRHSNLRPFECNVCGANFNRKTRLKVHMMIHTGEKPFMCTYPGCNKYFREKGNLNSHYKKHLEKQNVNLNLNLNANASVPQKITTTVQTAPTLQFKKPITTNQVPTLNESCAQIVNLNGTTTSSANSNQVTYTPKNNTNTQTEQQLEDSCSKSTISNYWNEIQE